MARQNVRFSVRNQTGAPLPYAYILVNGSTVAVTDVDGEALVPAGKLLPGDSIRFQYVGTEPAPMVWKQADTQEIHLEEIYTNGTETDAYKLLRKKLKRTLPIFYNNRMEASFRWENRINTLAWKVEGTFEAEHSTRSKEPSIHGHTEYKKEPLRITTTDDMSAFGSDVYLGILTQLSRMAVQVSVFNYVAKDPNGFRTEFPNARLEYRGQREAFHIFRLVFPPEDGGAQYLAFIHAQTGLLRRIECRAADAAGGWNYALVADYKLLKDKRSVIKVDRWADVLVFENIWFETHRPQKHTTTLHLWDPMITILPRD